MAFVPALALRRRVRGAQPIRSTVTQESYHRKRLCGELGRHLKPKNVNNKCKLEAVISQRTCAHG